MADSKQYGVNSITHGVNDLLI